MNLKTMLLLSGAAAAGVIVMAAAVVLTGSEPMGPPDDAAAALQPDPAAIGVIVTTHNGSYYTLTPSGELGYVSQPLLLPSGISSDGLWQAGIEWDEKEESAYLSVYYLVSDALDGKGSLLVHLPAALSVAEWAPQAALLVGLDESGALYLVDPGASETTLVAENVTAYAWANGDRLIYATQDNSGARLFGLDAARGPARELASLAGPITEFHVSPERNQVVFAQDGSDGWRLLSLDPQTDVIKDYGSLGSATRPVLEEAPEMAVAWSPSGRQFAVGPVSSPYVMYVVEAVGDWKGAYSTHAFEEGYAGEMTWSPDGTRLAISTYSPDRTRHEVYVMDVSARGGPRHLLDGCKIVWSPDGKFIAVKREPHNANGVSAIRVATGFNWLVAEQPALVPLAWGRDEQDAMARSAEPLPYAVRLVK